MKKNHYTGFTLIELLVVVAILAIIIVIALSMVKGERDKAQDATVKNSLNRLKIAFEDYYADHKCYPPKDYFDSPSDCNSSQLSPYLNKIPCDVNSGTPFTLETDNTGCIWFKLYGNLKSYQSDLATLDICDPNGSDLGNYVVSSDNVVAKVQCNNISSTPTTNPSPTPIASYDPSLNYYYCSTINNCTSYDPLIYSCSPSYTDNANCDGGSNPCQHIGYCTPR